MPTSKTQKDLKYETYCYAPRSYKNKVKETINNKTQSITNKAGETQKVMKLRAYFWKDKQNEQALRQNKKIRKKSEIIKVRNDMTDTTDTKDN